MARSDTAFHRTVTLHSGTPLAKSACNQASKTTPAPSDPMARTQSRAVQTRTARRTMAPPTTHTRALAQLHAPRPVVGQLQLSPSFLALQQLSCAPGNGDARTFGEKIFMDRLFTFSIPFNADIVNEEWRVSCPSVEWRVSCARVEWSIRGKRQAAPYPSINLGQNRDATCVVQRLPLPTQNPFITWRCVTWIMLFYCVRFT